MSDELSDGARRVFADHVTPGVMRDAEEGVFPAAAWAAVTEAGFTAAALPEAAGGFGTTVREAMRIVQVAAEAAAPLPVAETMLAGALLARAGLPVPGGVLTLAPVRSTDRLVAQPRGGGWHLSGTVNRVPWGRNASAFAAVADGPDGPLMVCVPAASASVAATDANLAGEPRDTMVIDGPAEGAAFPAGAGFLRAAGAALRTVQIAGASERALAVSVAYAGTRVQFGRPIGKFQAVQQNLAVMAGQSAAAVAAADMAAQALETALEAGPMPLLAVAAAKARAGEAASAIAGLAHGVHGAIGFTQEYELHRATRRLWSWRDEFGTEAEWNRVVGRAALRAGADGLWPLLTGAA